MRTSSEKRDRYYMAQSCGYPEQGRTKIVLLRVLTEYEWWVGTKRVGIIYSARNGNIGLSLKKAFQ